MIRFDNGPPGGDYVRYIDALMAQRAAALKLETIAADASGSFATAVSPRSTRASQRVPGLASAAAPGRATATTLRDDSHRVAPAIVTPMAAIAGFAITAGIVAILIGITGGAFNVLFIVAGIALISWAVKRLRRIAAPRADVAAADTFATAPMPRTSSRIEGKR